MAAVRIPEAVWRRVHDHLYSRRGEHFAFLRGRACVGDGGPVFLVHHAMLIPDAHVEFGRSGYQVSLGGILSVVNDLIKSDDALIEVHNHGGHNPRFSPTDRQELPSFVEYMLGSLPGRPYGATVWGNATVYGEYFMPDGTCGPFRSITVTGDQLQSIVSRADDFGAVPAGFDRQLPWFTAEGQRRLGRLRVAVVGAGGVGSHVIQQLSFLGVRDFLVVERDVADATSMNRLVSAGVADDGVSKGELARRLVQGVAPDACIDVDAEQVPSPRSLRLLKEADVIFGCVDNDGARLVLNEMALAYQIPYFDIAVGIDAVHGRVAEAGGRVAFVAPGGPCLQCMGELDLTEAQFELASPRERRIAKERGYVTGMGQVLISL